MVSIAHWQKIHCSVVKKLHWYDKTPLIPSGNQKLYCTSEIKLLAVYFNTRR